MTQVPPGPVPPGGSQSPEGGNDQYGAYGQYGPPGGTPPTYGHPAPPLTPGVAYGQPAPGGAPQYGAPNYGQYGAPSAAMAPPIAAQPGIIPLRPLTLGEIYDGAFRAVRSNPGVMFGMAAVIVGATLVLQTLVTFIIIDELETALLQDATAVDLATVAGGFVGIFLSGILTSLATLVYTGLAIVAVSEAVLGNKISMGELWRRARSRVFRLVLLTVVESIGAFLALATVYAIMALAFVALISTSAVTESSGGVVIGIILIPLVLVGLGILAAYIVVKLMLAPCVVMLEGTGIFAALARSWRLVKGHFWRLLGIMLLTLIIVTVIMSVVSMPITMGVAMFMPDNITVNLVVSSMANLLGSLITIPLIAAVMALLYIDVRMRKEGLDIELAQAAAAGR